MTHRWQIVLALSLIVLGITQLIGCFYIPAARQKIAGTQQDRPEKFFAAKTPTPKLKLGESTLEDFTCVTGQQIDYMSVDHHYAITQFEVEGGTWVYPLCFMAYTETHVPRYLAMRLDEQGHIVSYKTFTYMEDAYRQLKTEFEPTEARRLRVRQK